MALLRSLKTKHGLAVGDWFVLTQGNAKWRAFVEKATKFAFSNYKNFFTRPMIANSQ
jgi:hypothetical protein